MSAACELDAIHLPVNNELGDSIVAAWIKLHMEWAQDAYDNAVHGEDKADATADLLALRRVYRYITGEEQ